MPLRVRITKIDTEGFTGRDPHPPTNLAGLTARVLGIEPDPNDFELLIYLVQVEGETALHQLVEHEMEILGWA